MTFTKEQFIQHLTTKPVISKTFFEKSHNPFVEKFLGKWCPDEASFDGRTENIFYFLFNHETGCYETPATINETLADIQADLEFMETRHFQNINEIPLGLDNLSIVCVSIEDASERQTEKYNTNYVVRITNKHITRLILLHDDYDCNCNAFFGCDCEITNSDDKTFKLIPNHKTCYTVNVTPKRNRYTRDSYADESIFFVSNDGDITIRYAHEFKNKEIRMLPLPITVTIDTLRDIDVVNESLFDGFAPFQLVKDLQNEIVATGYKHVSSHHLTRTPVSYDDVLPRTSRNDVLTTKWKGVATLQQSVNTNKLTVNEIRVFMNLSKKLTETEFNRVYNWFAKNKASVRKSLSGHVTQIRQSRRNIINVIANIVYTMYISQHCGLKLDLYFNMETYDIYDMVHTWNELRALKHYKFKLQFNFTSIKQLHNFDKKLVHEYNHILSKKNDKIKLYTESQWEPVCDWVKRTDLNVKLLDSYSKLADESDRQRNCVVTYFDYAKDGKELLLHVDYKNQPHTVEIVIDNDKYKVVQNRTKCNQDAVDGCTEAIQAELDELQVA